MILSGSPNLSVSVFNSSCVNMTLSMLPANITENQCTEQYTCKTIKNNPYVALTHGSASFA